MSDGDGLQLAINAERMVAILDTDGVVVGYVAERVAPIVREALAKLSESLGDDSLCADCGGELDGDGYHVDGDCSNGYEDCA